MGNQLRFFALFGWFDIKLQSKGAGSKAYCVLKYLLPAHVLLDCARQLMAVTEQ